MIPFFIAQTLSSLVSSNAGEVVLTKVIIISLEWWSTPVISALRRQRQEVPHMVEASLGYTMRSKSVRTL